MSAECKVQVIASLTGLGKLMEMIETMTTTTTPTTKGGLYQIQAVADTAEALNIGDVTTPELIVIIAVSKKVYVDTTYVSSFVAEIEIQEGEFAIFKPKGTVYIKNGTSAETVTVETFVVGT